MQLKLNVILDIDKSEGKLINTLQIANFQIHHYRKSIWQVQNVFFDSMGMFCLFPVQVEYLKKNIEI